MTHTLPEPREATPDDKENILRVIGSYPQAKWDRPIAKKYFDDFFKYGKVFEYDKVYVIEDDHNIVGVIGYHTDKYETKNVWLGWFYVHSDYQKRGYGKHLFKFIKDKLKNKDVGKLFVDTSSNEFYQTALLQYIKLGFTLEAVIKSYYGKNEDQLILSIEI
jgi:ribosomal protein S18 acetylase RimI-like enzyme